MNRFVLAALASAAIATTAFADGSGHAHHGGQAVKIGQYEVELVVKGKDVTAYVLDQDDRKVDASTLTATAIVLAKGNQQNVIDFKPAGDNKLSARYDFPIDGKFRATLSIKSPAGDAGKGRYNINIGH